MLYLNVGAILKCQYYSYNYAYFVSFAGRCEDIFLCFSATFVAVTASMYNSKNNSYLTVVILTNKSIIKLL